MSAPALIIMAAGIGSRYGGLKQIDPIGPNGEIIIDYSIYDALRAGFEKVVFVIRRDLEAAFREKIGRKIEDRVETIYVYQEVSNVPPGYQVPPERTKPWGTGHAVLSCKDVVTEPFAVINADDFYGSNAFRVMGEYLRTLDGSNDAYDYSMVGYVLRNTLSEFGSVARGVCEIGPDGYLLEVNERTRIVKDGADARYSEDGETWTCLSGDAIVSMNYWGFMPSLFMELEQRFARFLAANVDRINKAEFFLPAVVNQLLQEEKARVKVLPVAEKWFGVTNPEDRASVQAALRALVKAGIYPDDLWNRQHA